MAKPNPTLPTPTPPQPRFQIAARLGGFRDTITVPDPFGTPATFTLYRAGCNAYVEWQRDRMDANPVLAEMMMGVDSLPPVLAADEQEAVDAARAKVDGDDTARALVPVIDRLTLTTTGRQLEREALRKAIAGGKLRPSDAFLRGADDQLAEALFTLRGWDGMPDETGALVPYTLDAARALLTNDTPLEGAGIDELVLAQAAWVVETPGAPAEGDTPAASPTRTILPGLTLGRAYLLYFLAVSADRARFRAETLEAAAKNSETPSGGSTLSGGGNDETAN